MTLRASRSATAAALQLHWLRFSSCGFFPPVKNLLPGVFLCPVMTASPVTGCSQVVLFASSLLGEKKRGEEKVKKQPTRGIRVEPSPNFPSRWYLLEKEDASVASHAVTPWGRQARQPLWVEVRRHVWALRAALELRASDPLARTRDSLATVSRAQAGEAPLGGGAYARTNDVTRRRDLFISYLNDIPIYVSQLYLCFVLTEYNKDWVYGQW